MKSLTEHLWFEVPNRRGFVNITSTVEGLVKKSGVQDGLCLCSAMHITLTPGSDTSQQRANARETIALEQHCDFCTADFVWAGAVENDVAVPWNLMPPFLDIMDVNVSGAGNQIRVLFQFRGRPKVKNERISSGLLLTAQIIDRDASSAQLMAVAVISFCLTTPGPRGRDVS